jgi:hypothetical protein
VRAPRSIALIAAALLAATACDAAGDPTDTIDGVATDDGAGAEDGAPSGDGEPAPEGGQDGQAAPDQSGADDGPSSPDTSGEQPAEPPPAGTGTPAATTQDLGRVGANGRAMLRADHASLVIEVDVQQGRQPSQTALDHLAATLDRHADKPGGIRFAGGNTFTSDRTDWSASDLRAVAAANRSTSSTGDTVSLYLLYVDGGFFQDGEQTNAIGVTYNASEIALFPERWSGLGSVLGSDQQLERAVLVHELGHALGLINLTYDSAIAHEDPDHPGHSDNRGSVMFWAIETTLIGQVFSGPPPDTFDEADAADLDGLRTGRY